MASRLIRGNHGGKNQKLDKQPFDELIVAVGSGMTRRRILRGLGGGVAATVWRLLGTGAADAGKTTKKGKGGNGGGKGRNTDRGRGRARGLNKVAICHYQVDYGTSQYTRLPESAAAAH